MPREAAIDQREITENGTVQVRIAKKVIDAGEVLASGWHRCALEPGQNVDDMISAVDADLTNQGYGPVQDWSGVRATVAAEHTPEVIKAHEDAQAAAKAARDADRGL
jgi:hypothetical protein